MDKRRSRKGPGSWYLPHFGVNNIYKPNKIRQPKAKEFI